MERKFSDVSSLNLTPAMRQYISIKSNYEDCILFFRMGDFYEMFFEDAIIASKILDIALTSRDGQIPMCGVPYHSAQVYISKLVQAGYKVAICEQMESAETAKGIVKREVVRVITPGLITDLESISPYENNYILSIYKNVYAYTDITTQEFKVIVSEGEPGEIISKIKPKEVLYCEDEVLRFLEGYRTEKISISKQKALELLNFVRAEGEEKEKLSEDVIVAIGMIIYYASQNIKDIPLEFPLPQIVGDYSPFADERTMKNLEIFETREGYVRSLLWILDKTSTPMGKRTLRKWLANPLKEKEKIEERISAIEEIISKKFFDELPYGDIERYAVKLLRGTINPRELVKLAKDLEKKINFSPTSSLLKKIFEKIYDFSEFVSFVKSYIVEEPPLKAEDGAIRKGVNPQLDELMEIKENSQKILEDYERKERERTKIPLKIGYSSHFGYYIEVTKSYLKSVPDYFRRKQTLVNSERFTTDELERIGEKVESAEERIRKLQSEIYLELVEKLKPYSYKILDTASAIGEIYALISLARCAYERGYTKPNIVFERKIVIKDGRHPVVEEILKGERFIPNDTNMDEKNPLWIITGPNMSGKSTYIRQIGIIVYLAHIGSFVPCSFAEIGLCDRIFFRTGASDDISSGRSTFFVEMEEVAEILKSATPSSLIIFDEIGRGTSTFDGISIAWAIAEYVRKIGARCFFATHFHELSYLEDNLEGVENWHFSAKDVGGRIVFLRKIRRGSAGKSWGVHVARLAGIPEEIVQRAEKILMAIEEGKVGKIIKRSVERPVQLSIFQNVEKDILRKELRKINLDELKPLEALQILAELKRIAEEQ